MQHTKKFLALILALALAFALALPAFAEGEPEPGINWDEFVITKQPKNLKIKAGERFTLSVEVTAPDGVEVTYQWYNARTIDENPALIEGATASTLSLGPDDPGYPGPDNSKAEAYDAWYSDYYCLVRGTYEDDGGALKSSSSRVTVAPNYTFWQRLYWSGRRSLESAIGGSAMILVMTSFLALPVVPIAFVVFMVWSFYDSFTVFFK